MPGRTRQPLGVQLAAAQEELAAARRRADLAEAQLNGFKEEVREVALEVRRENGWCDQGFNDTMDKLGLEKLPHTFVVEVEVTAKQVISVEIDADNLEEENCTEAGARAYVEESGNVDFSDHVSSYNWEYEDEVDIKSVEVLTD